MPTLTYASAGFNTAKYPRCTSENTVIVYWSNLVWAAITAGKAGASEINQHKEYSRHERLMRLHMIKMNWKESAKGEFQQTDLYKALDGSEKTAISYFMGLTMAKYLSGHCLTVPWVLHYDSYLKSHGQKLKGTRPDLIGMNPQKEWFVLEAKGRSNAIESGLMESALEQACRAQPINIKNYVPIACISYTKGAGILHATWEDPEGESNDEGYTIDPLDFLQHYYEPLRSLIDSNSQGAEVETHGNREYITRYFPDLDVRIGLLNEIDSYFLEQSGWYAVLTERLPKLRRILGQEPVENGRDRFIGPDGVLIWLGTTWSAENMLKEPSQRSFS
ncbi:hypothetical protein [Hymenobacter lucidus]|uniref:Uncharacterized protein n=1 Tax=Hymenobacter lucidus TaxID=2880930 RepID=A0ABS8AZ26_9BACT|nr:hypothetical protein [Hymenobacter lucidus]MCB2411042.1 hypothetical protein [Hymenobacter lucidus]